MKYLPQGACAVYEFVEDDVVTTVEHIKIDPAAKTESETVDNVVDDEDGIIVVPDKGKPEANERQVRTRRSR
jgi:hypothetical protein